MSIKEKIAKLLLPEGAVILTKEEVAALSKYVSEHLTGGDPVEKE
jgi:hypothetical protein